MSNETRWAALVTGEGYDIGVAVVRVDGVVLDALVFGRADRPVRPEQWERVLGEHVGVARADGYPDGWIVQAVLELLGKTGGRMYESPKRVEMEVRH